MIRAEDHRSVARSELGRGDRATPPPSSSASRPNTARTPSAASPRRAAPTKRPSWCRSWSAPASATTMSTPARASATRRPATAWPRPSAPRPARRISTRSSRADVVIVIGANPTDAHPVFASRMKKRLREGAKLIVIDPRRIDLVRTPHVEAALSPAASARHQRRRAHRAGACHRHREGWSNEKFVRERCDWDEFQHWAAFVSQPQNSPEAVAKVSGVPRARRSAAPRGSTPPAATARSITGSASPSTARARPR